MLDVFTTDALVDGVHFDRRFVPPDALGHRALAVNLSDLAAMGAEPRAALLSLALPPTLEVREVDGLLDGLLALGAAHHVTVIGGNVTRTPGPLTIDVTAVGCIRPRRVMTRDGARPGDDVYVTGALGGAAIGLQVASRQAESGESTEWSVARERYLRPQPRVRAGTILGRTRAASSCMDLSDGLADGVRQVAEASGVGITLDAAALPLDEGVREWHATEGGDPIETALIGGDDYELLFTVRPAHRGRFRGARRHFSSLPVTRIGVVTKERATVVRDDAGSRPLPEGYEHFR